MRQHRRLASRVLGLGGLEPLQPEPRSAPIYQANWAILWVPNPQPAEAPFMLCSMALRGSSKDDRGQARSKPSGLDGGPREPLPFQRRHRRAYVQDDPAGPAGDDGPLAAADDDRP